MNEAETYNIAEAKFAEMINHNCERHYPSAPIGDAGISKSVDRSEA